MKCFILTRQSVGTNDPEECKEKEFIQKGYINKKHNMTNNARKEAWKFFFPAGNGRTMITVDPITGKDIQWVLHHVDETLKKNDIKRYKEWRIEDLVMITSTEHHIIHSNGNKNPFYGKHHTEDTKERLSGENNPMYGKKHTAESKKKMSEARKGTKFTEEHKNKIAEALKSHVGWHHWTNGVVSVCSVECPRRWLGSRNFN